MGAVGVGGTDQEHGHRSHAWDQLSSRTHWTSRDIDRICDHYVGHRSKTAQNSQTASGSLAAEQSTV